MQWVLNAIFRNKNFLLFLFLFFLGLLFSSNQSAYHQSKLAKTSLLISGMFYEPFNQIKNYFNLSEQNKALIKENNHLKGLVLDKFLTAEILSLEEENLTDPSYWSMPAKVVRNSHTKARNMILINKGSSDGITQDMGVIGSLGIVGIVNQTTSGFASVLSILHKDVKINAKFKSSNVFGSLSWTGFSADQMILEDISEINTINIGDTLVTGGMSSYFPEGIPIGYVSSYSLPKSGGYYEIEVTLLNNMTDLGYVYVIGNKKRAEIETLIRQE